MKPNDASQHASHRRHILEPTPKRHTPWPTERNEPMAHELNTEMAHLNYAAAHARWTGDTVRADEAYAALDAATLRCDAEQWATVYRQVLVDNRHE